MRINFYNDDSKRCVYNVHEPISSGANGFIFKLRDDECLKYFIYHNFYNVETLRTVMGLDLDNFYKVYDFLYNENGEFVAYTMQYYEKDNVDILNVPVEYTIENYYRLLESVKKISDALVMMNDLHDGNVLLQNDKMIVVDIDLYERCNYNDSKTMFNYNCRLLLHMFEEMYIEYLRHNFCYLDCDKRIIQDLFSSKNGIDAPVKKLMRYKKPMDYIQDRRLNN